MKNQKVWRDKDASDLILKDGEVHRTPLMMKDTAASFCCSECQGRGRWLDDLNITCPYCSGSGMVSATGGPVERNTANETESSRGGEFGADRASITDAEMRDRLAKDAAWREASIGHRPGWRVTDAGKEHHMRMQDMYAKLDDEREAAYKTLDAEYVASPSGEKNVGSGSPSRNFGRSPQEGDACTTNSGLRGTIRNGECVASSEDSRTTTQIVQDHQVNMEQRYRDYENQISNAYRTLGE